MMELHVSREARDRYHFDQSLFSLVGCVVFANLRAARVFAQEMNARRDLVRFPERAVRAGQINAMGLIHEIMHYVMGLYRQQVKPGSMQDALEWLEDRLGRRAVDAALRSFVDEFPPMTVYRRDISADDYLAGETDGVPNRQAVLEEMLLLWLANVNPAFAPFKELFTDDDLARETAYTRIMASLHQFFEAQPPFGPDNQNLVDMLRAPARAVPHSLAGQLEYIQEHWGGLLGKYLYRLLGSLDLIREEQKAVFMGPGPSVAYEYGALELDAERFSPDRDWMPQVVLMAKNAYVWLYQLSQQYGRPITHLNHIPDEELDRLARWGFSGLWLIGIWERSPASRKIKQLTGNPEAVASAYSLYDYVVAADLGGPEAYESLKERAWRRGIRLASDMVPNHVGIYSRWMIEHPDWFIALDHSPFPSYTFSGPDLSDDERVGIFIEDHYYTRTDAAVVFKRVDRWTGSEKYIYHGNDGTAMPWNDTAQLNYLNPEVREAVIQTILHVARQFPIIRFDAAMTLAKKHFQRLWFPEPGTGGAIPSRAEHAMTREQFDAAMPKEFWREVVDRVAAEAPDTLLLAEAFWLLEGYFVRTLGMHRVYNSAFMNMLRDEENAKYRQLMKNTLEFEPEILKRFVNFMNNPDEETAVAQFGKGDKYFGVATLLATLPGLPMFGHGQVEGLAEKYGMEYRRAYWDEDVDPYLVERHQREIFPLLHRRYLFAEVRDFLLYDFFTPEGSVNEDVLAYSNRSGDERALVAYHNRYASTRGWIKSSVAFAVSKDGDRGLAQKGLAEGLGLHDDESYYAIFRDHVTGLEYIRNSKALRDEGLYLELDAYKCHVFLDWREVQDNEWRQYAHLADYLRGRGVPSIEEALREVFLEPIHGPFRDLFNAGHLRWLVTHRVAGPDGELDDEIVAEAARRAWVLLRETATFTGGAADVDAISAAIRRRLEAALRLPRLAEELPLTEADGAAIARVVAFLDDDPAAWGILLGWLFIQPLGKVAAEEDYALQSRSWIDEWLLGKILSATFQDLGLDEGPAWWAVSKIKLLVGKDDWCQLQSPDGSEASQVLTDWLGNSEVQQLLQVNRYGGVLWFNHETLTELLDWVMAVSVIAIVSDPALSPEEAAQAIASCRELLRTIEEAEEASGYQVEKLLSLV